MVEPLYVPVLPVRRGAVTAYLRLSPAIRHRLAPLWTLPPRTGPERTSGASPPPDSEADGHVMNAWLTPRVDRLIEAMDGNPGWVDAGHVESELHGSAVAVQRLITRSGMVLVTAPGRDRTLQRYAADLAFLSGRGLAIRMAVDEPPDEPRSTELLALVDRLRMPPSHLDLILDAGEVRDVAESGKRSLVALDLLGSLLPWRTVVLTAGAFPRAAETFEAGAASAITSRPERHDWALHEWIRRARPDQAPVYGDYSVEHALGANLAEDRFGGYGPPWGLLRYTGPGHFLVARAPTRGNHRTDRVRALARWIVRDEAFRCSGADRSSAEDWWEACAEGVGSRGSGSPETWSRMGHIQHLTYVTRCLLSRGAGRQ
ncbi:MULTISPECIES: beta family protein [unclassified Streptomyces]|uniref:beta family protein n=1 Tax=unclassified Streptomyces TaxID=2593676 RepID=UPI002E10F560|nr:MULTISPECIES: hypothetical protein [unclassified Streptomyces]WSJ26193.1 beta family protein [Streptomyces sp. NBC_01324]